jgi:chromosome partitioning protein
MSLFDPTRPDALPHAGTFNNNTLTMTVGNAAMTEVYTPDACIALNARGDRLREALDRFLTETTVPPHYVFIDCPPSLGLLTLNALVAAPEVLIPIQCEYYALEGVSQLMKNIEMVKAHLNPQLNVTTVILTMYDGRTKLADQVATEVRRFFGDKVLRTVIPRSVKVSEAPGYSMTIIDYDPGSRGAMSYLDASRELALRPA